MITPNLEKPLASTSIVHCHINSLKEPHKEQQKHYEKTKISLHKMKVIFLSKDKIESPSSLYEKLFFLFLQEYISSIHECVFMNFVPKYFQKIPSYVKKNHAIVVNSHDLKASQIFATIRVAPALISEVFQS